MPPSHALIWGSTFNGEATVYKPVPLPGDLQLIAGLVQVSTNFACGLTANGSAWCIGRLCMQMRHGTYSS